MGMSDVLKVFNLKSFQNITSDHKQLMQFCVYYVLNKIIPQRYFARLRCTLLETLFNGFQNTVKGLNPGVTVDRVV